MIKYILDGLECQPKNRDAIRYELDFSDRRIRELELSVDALHFVSEDYDRIKTWRNTYGDFVGMPLNIQYSSGQIVPYLLDFSDSSTRFQDRGCFVKLVRFNGIDNFFSNADGLAFTQIKWNTTDFVNVDYIVLPDQQFSYYVSLSLASFALKQQLAQAVKDISDGISDLIKATVPVGLPIPGPDWGAIIVLAIKLVARIAYALFIIIALIRVITEILNVLFPKIRQFKGATVKRLIEKGCQQLNFGFQSSLLNGLNGLAILPVPLRPKIPNYFQEVFLPSTIAFTNGYPSNRDSVFTLGQLISAVEEIFNAKTRVINGVVRIEQESVFEQQATGGLDIAFTIQEALQSEYKVNVSEQFKRMLIKYQTDVSDLNTFDDTKDKVFEISSDVLSSPDRRLELVRGLYTVDIPFSAGTPKGKLNFVENTAKTLAKAVDLFTGGNLASTINDRKNVLQLSNQFFNQTKLLLLNGSRIATNQNQVIGASVLANNYHYSRFITNNQKNIYEGMPCAITESELFSIIANNFIILSDGTVAEIRRVSWSEREHQAIVDFSIRTQSINVTNRVVDAG